MCQMCVAMGRQSKDSAALAERVALHSERFWTAMKAAQMTPQDPTVALAAFEIAFATMEACLHMAKDKNVDGQLRKMFYDFIEELAKKSVDFAQGKLSLGAAS